MSDDDPKHGVFVPFRQMYDDLRTLIDEMRILTQELKESRKTDDDHEKRIRILERWMWGLPVSIVAAMAAAVKAFTS